MCRQLGLHPRQICAMVGSQELQYMKKGGKQLLVQCISENEVMVLLPLRDEEGCVGRILEERAVPTTTELNPLALGTKNNRSGRTTIYQLCFFIDPSSFGSALKLGMMACSTNTATHINAAVTTPPRNGGTGWIPYTKPSSSQLTFGTFVLSIHQCQSRR
ncbi:unnamed protein product [Absidia cylindrospora]